MWLREDALQVSQYELSLSQRSSLGHRWGHELCNQRWRQQNSLNKCTCELLVTVRNRWPREHKSTTSSRRCEVAAAIRQAQLIWEMRNCSSGKAKTTGLGTLWWARELCHTVPVKIILWHWLEMSLQHYHFRKPLSRSEALNVNEQRSSTIIQFSKGYSDNQRTNVLFKR